ncbi:pentatricopeptide repeat-containing protein At4g35850, mitochondrial-like [Ziziphus jujuba]|uniref:Pentatricopeptide repeat-containing protein At4g35850, mitochondrial-like n=1 Tax=Ziziphus jujuba TaxID=326968 RepID=A0ABM3ZWZ1_ZIZJJ|nr:pentatricopeptide repeat-containing protein At4g35850, mitochondrial-like [Ziziphus jujuba]
MRLIRSITGQRNSLLREVGWRYFSSISTEEYARRNYASNVSEYNTIIGSLTAQRRHFLLRDVYDDMMLDGVQPTRDTFHSLIVGTMKSSCLQDAFYFSDQMKSMGLVPDVTLYNILVS